MSELTQEQYDQLPDFVKGDYQEVDGVFKHAGVLKLKTSLNEVDSKYKTQIGELSDKLNSFEEAKKREIENARKEALEQAKNKGDRDEIERIYEEKMADLEKRVEERTRSAVEKEFTLKSAQKDAESLATKISAQLASDDDARQDLQDLISLRVKPDESGKIVFYNRDGSASAMTEKEFVEDIKSKHKHLIKGDVTTQGGGMANGSKGGGSAEPKGDNAARNNLRQRLKQKGLSR